MPNHLRRGFPAAAAAVLLFLPLLAGAQSVNSRSLEEELDALELSLSDPRVSPAEGYETLEKIAALHQLSGNLEEAAAAWNRAAFRGNEWRLPSLLSAVRCYIALGELDAAENLVKIFLAQGKASPLEREGIFLGRLIEALSSGNGAPLAALLGNPEYSSWQPALLYTLWRLDLHPGYRAQLASKYPQSPEALTAEGTILGAANAHWILLSGRSRITAIPAPALPLSRSPVPAASAVPADVQGTGPLQAGIFSREENAVAMVERLRKAGFTPYITLRRLEGAPYFGVNVPGGQEAVIKLKDMGIEAFAP